MKEETTTTVYSLFLFFYSAVADADVATEAACSAEMTAVQALSGYLSYSAAVDVVMDHSLVVTETVAVAAAS